MVSETLLGLPDVDERLAADLQSGLADVDARLRELVKSDYPFVTETSRHLVDAGGKRFRPMLVLLGAQFGDPKAREVTTAAVVVEMTHLATLYHDDVMDEAAVRRGAASANNRWTNTIAILTGDFLFARASDILADLGPQAVRIQARTFERLVHGQIRETVGPPPGTDPLEHYLRVVSDKTASLIATSGRFGAMMSGADEKIVQVMVTFGERIGVAFQLSDDLLDVASEVAVFGKAPGTDLREGVATLPVLHAHRSSDPSGERLRQLLATDLATDDARHAEALDLLRRDPAMDLARADLCRWVDDARDALEPLPAGPARDALHALCEFVLARTS